MVCHENLNCPMPVYFGRTTWCTLRVAHSGKSYDMRNAESSATKGVTTCNMVSDFQKVGPKAWKKSLTCLHGVFIVAQCNIIAW